MWRGRVNGSARLRSYGTSKGGVLGLAGRLAAEAGEHGIAVNAISPSAFTELSRQGFAAVFKRSLFAKGLNVDPADDDMLLERSAAVVSAVVAWLCHSDCRFNGGLLQAEAGGGRRLPFSLARGRRDPQL